MLIRSELNRFDVGNYWLQIFSLRRIRSSWENFQLVLRVKMQNSVTEKITIKTKVEIRYPNNLAVIYDYSRGVFCINFVNRMNSLLGFRSE